MPQGVADLLLVCWVLYVTFMTVVSWFTGSVSNFEDFVMSIIAWMFLVVIGLAIRGKD